MTPGAMVLMIVVLSIVWGGCGLTLWFAIRQERRRKKSTSARPEDLT